jgi:RNA polymerase subunit RPABC4/transcription elongation factor Spt4
MRLMFLKGNIMRLISVFCRKCHEKDVTSRYLVYFAILDSQQSRIN